MLLNKSFIPLSFNLTSIRTVSTKTLRPKQFTSILAKVPSCPRSGWQIYLREQIDVYKSEGEKTSVPTLTKELGPKWKSLPSEEQKKYNDRYQEEFKKHKEQYDLALKNASPKAIHDENILRKQHNLPLLKDPKKPKRPKNAYLFYLESVRHDTDYQGLAVAEQAHNAALAYKDLDEEEKKPFVIQAEKDHERYVKEMEMYNKQIK
ncbi:hypothetical protein BJ944DRAFT_270056 [Cunninghamella echinulata]|nr:hypothetical protein BJ944DRAFT_270056 [Cunninghamella echinulata]